MNNLLIFWLLLLNFSFSSLFFAQNAEDEGLVPTILSNLWELDSDNRNRIQQKYLNGTEGKNLIDGLMNSFGINPFKREYSNYCDGWIDAESTNDFLVALNSTQIFQNAAAQFAPNSLLQSFQQLFFSPQNNPPFISLFCEFSMDSATSFSLLGNYHQLADKLVETVADEDTLLIRLRGEDGKMAKRRILLGPSPQFELTAIALCAIYGEGGGKGKLGWKHCTAKIGNGKMLRIAMKMNEDGKVIAYFPQIQQRKPPKPNPNPELQKLVEQLWEKDVDRVEPGTISLNWQGKLKNGQVADISPDPLFANVNETFLQKPIYAALVEMYKEKDFHEQVCEEEPPMSQERRQKFEKLWGLIIGSEVFKTAYEYLDKLNKTGGDFDGFCDKLFGFWFGTYSRCKQKHRIGGFWHQNEDEPLGSSGFEHVFSGEWRQGIVEGHHNWIRYYLQEKDGDINYHGYFGHEQQNYIGTFQYKWKGFLKKIGGFFFQTSPAFDFSIFTVCVLTQPGNEQCQFELFNNSKLFITSFRQPCQHGSSCIATTYPGEWY